MYMSRGVVCAAAVVLAGCASVNKQPVSAGAKSELRDQRVATTKRAVPDFAAMTAGKAAFAVLGALAMISEGNGIIARNKVADPADAIAAGLVASLAGGYSARAADQPVSVAVDDVAGVATAANGAARFIVDVQTLNWSFGYFPSDWTHYRVIYTAKARLIDAQSKSVVAEGFCKQIPETNEGAPTYDELLAGQAALLKARLAAAGEACLQTLKAEMLSL